MTAPPVLVRNLILLGPRSGVTHRASRPAGDTKWMLACDPTRTVPDAGVCLTAQPPDCAHCRTQWPDR